MDITWVMVNDHRDKATYKKKKIKKKIRKLQQTNSKIKPTNYLDVV